MDITYGETMTGRERIIKALNHEEADRIPLGILGMPACEITVGAYRNLLNYLGIEIQTIKILDTIQQLALVDDIVYEKLGIDVRRVIPGKPTDWTYEINEEKDCYWLIDEWQRKWKMPKVGGFYYDMVSFPLKDTELDDYSWPDPIDPVRFAGIERETQAIHEDKKSAAVFMALGNGFLQQGAQLFGYEKWFMMLALEPEKVERFLDRYLEFKISYWDAALSKIGNKLDIVVELDDLGTQNAGLISLDMWRKLIKPYTKKLFSFFKKRTKAKLFFHSCGSICTFIPDLIDIGVDILNPVQITAANMDSKKLKKEFGKDLVFWGGGIDTQNILPHGTKEEVEAEVRRRIDDFAPGGGYVFATVHNIQDDVPPENIVSMLETLERYGKY